MMKSYRLFALVLIAGICVQLVSGLKRISEEYALYKPSKYDFLNRACDYTCKTGLTNINDQSCESCCISKYKFTTGRCYEYQKDNERNPHNNCECTNYTKRPIEWKETPSCTQNCRVKMADTCKMCCTKFDSVDDGVCQGTKWHGFGPKVCLCKFYGKEIQMTMLDVKKARNPKATSQNINVFRGLNTKKAPRSFHGMQSKAVNNRRRRRI